MKTIVLALCVFTSGVAVASNYDLAEIPHAIPPKEAAKLKAAGIATTFALLEKAGDPQQRKSLARTLKIPESTLDTWVQMSDLCRIRGIGPDVARLLRAASVRSVEALKQADADKLAEEVNRIAVKQKLSENPPSADHLRAWIKQATTLPIVLH